MKYKAIIFDLDGTLIDSLEDIANCSNRALEEFGYPKHKIDDYRYFVGDGAKVLIENAMNSFENITNNDIEKVLKLFKDIYDKNIHSNTKPYNEIYELLDYLETLPLKKAILSNKPHKFTLKYAQTLFYKYDFSQVYGQIEGIGKKPDPTLALKIANEFDIKPSEILYVGDTATDMLTASNAGFDSIGVLWGFRNEEELRGANANYIVSSPLDIIQIVIKE